MSIKAKRAPLGDQHTLYASYLANVSQAAVNNFAPLLLLVFQREFGVSLDQVALLVGFNFAVQLVTDLLSSWFIDRIGWRKSIVGAHVLCSLGLVCLAVLPQLAVKPFHGLLISVLIYAVGGGILEVLVSPIVEACPTAHKGAAMSLLHSFYCWGHLFVVLLTTAFFALAGTANWRWMAFIWALLPAANALYYARVPLYPLPHAQPGRGSVMRLLRIPAFWVLFVLMVCAGASEHGLAQWASAFAEGTLGIPKAWGDILGPSLFALMMGTARALHAKWGRSLAIRRAMMASAVLCVIAYLLAALSPWPALALAAIGLGGFSVGLFWPGTFTMAAQRLPAGGTPMYALLALAGDLGCSAGATSVGVVASLANDNLRMGFLAAIIFPLVLLAFVALGRRGTPASQ